MVQSHREAGHLEAPKKFTGGSLKKKLESDVHMWWQQQWAHLPGRMEPTWPAWCLPLPILFYFLVFSLLIRILFPCSLCCSQMHFLPKLTHLL